MFSRYFKLVSYSSMIVSTFSVIQTFKCDIKQLAYSRSLQYWNKQENTNDGVMGGYGYLNTPDIRDSDQFLQTLKQIKQIEFGKVLELGAGIGRVSSQLLTKYYSEIHLVEQNDQYSQTAKSKLQTHPNISFQVHNCSILDFDVRDQYDCIWIQWISLYLTDSDFLKLISTLRQHLKQNGVVILKENISNLNYVPDEDDASVTRSEEVFKKLFNEAGYELVHEQYQADFPDEIYAVKMFCFESIKQNDL